ncbi:MAG TPA: class I SAM-dependent methyltransferase [Thermoanaerobaculia bacterium]|nr:class I SAM-dependent methyltransferase [Thermoanaerobaculia bacterium]
MSGDAASLPAAVRAFDALAPLFDERFSAWKSVAAQRRAVRRALLATFPEGSTLIELGGGTGEDALFLAQRGRRVFVTDGAPAMVARATEKARAAGAADRVAAERVSLEDLDAWAAARKGTIFDGAFSNFASLNCVTEHVSVARGLAHVLPAGRRALLVVFGPFSPGEILVLLARGETRAAFRRLRRSAAPARVSGESFTVTYPSPKALATAFAPWFRLRGTRGVGIFVPPSSAEPVASRFPRLLGALERLDRLAARPLALLGDHVLLDFERTAAPV